MKPNLVDFHAHLDLYPDLAESIRACENAKTATLAVTTTPRAFPRNEELTGESNFVRVALGLHPQLVSERASEVPIFEEFLPRTRYVGEVGLDASPRFYRSLERQKEVFGHILRLCAQAGDKILSVHSVRSVKSVLDMVENILVPGRGRVVLHWFTGSSGEARRAVDLGCYFSINERMLSSLKAKATLTVLPTSRLLTESDGPFVERNGVPVGPGDVANAVNGLAEAFSRSPQDMAKLIRSNLAELVR